MTRALKKLTGPLLSRLKRQREQAWIGGCELFSTGIDPGQKEIEVFNPDVS